MKHAKMGALIAIAAGGLFVSGCKKEEKGSENKEPAPKAEPDKKPDPAATKADEKPADPPAEKTAMVDCMGVNACKGQGTCKTDKHGCGGQNECKGQGVLAMTEGECAEKGGTVFAKR